MADNKDQGTGHHKHKSSEEPYPHHEAPTTKGESGKSGTTSGRSESHSSGEHRSGERQGEHKSSSSGSNNRSSGSESKRGNEDADLKRREYRGPDGEEHHHTKTYMEQHGSEGSSGRKESGSEHSSGGGSHRKAS